MGPPLYMRSIVDRNVVTWCMTVIVNKDPEKETVYALTFWDAMHINYNIRRHLQQSVMSVSYARWPYFEIVD